MTRGWRCLALIALLAAGSCSAPAMRAYELSLAISGDRSWAAWHGGTGEGSAIFVQPVGRAGALSGAPSQVSDGKHLAYEPDLVARPGGLAVAWYEKDAGTGRLAAMLAGMDASGQRQWQVRLGGNAARDARNPVVRLLGRDIAVAWIEQDHGSRGGARAQVRYERFTLAGRPIAPARMIGAANADTWNLNAATFGDAFVLSYDASIGVSAAGAGARRAHELQMLVVRPAAIEHRQITPPDGHGSLYPDLQISRNGIAALTWFDEKDGNREVYLVVAPFASLGTANMPQLVRVTHDKGESIGAYVAWNGRTAALAWRDNSSGRSQIYARRFDGGGRAIGPMERLSASQGQASVPAIRARGAGFLVAWNDYVAGADSAHGAIQSSEVVLRTLPVELRRLAMKKVLRKSA